MDSYPLFAQIVLSTSTLQKYFAIQLKYTFTLESHDQDTAGNVRNKKSVCMFTIVLISVTDLHDKMGLMVYMSRLDSDQPLQLYS